MLVRPVVRKEFLGAVRCSSESSFELGEGKGEALKITSNLAYFEIHGMAATKLQLFMPVVDISARILGYLKDHFQLMLVRHSLQYTGLFNLSASFQKVSVACALLTACDIKRTFTQSSTLPELLLL